jgi:hypothetical protein
MGARWTTERKKSYMRAYFRVWNRRKRDDEAHREYKRNWMRAKRKKVKPTKEYLREQYRKNKEKFSAHAYVYRAIRSGKLKRPNRCQECLRIPPKGSDGRSGMHAHHENYNFPLRVKFLCTTCHNKLRRTL